MNFTTYDINVDGYTIGVSNDPVKTGRDSLLERNQFLCWLRNETHTATLIVSREGMKDPRFCKTVLKMLLRELSLVQQ